MQCTIVYVVTATDKIVKLWQIRNVTNGQCHITMQNSFGDYCMYALARPMWQMFKSLQPVTAVCLLLVQNFKKMPTVKADGHKAETLHRVINVTWKPRNWLTPPYNEIEIVFRGPPSFAKHSRLLMYTFNRKRKTMIVDRLKCKKKLFCKVKNYSTAIISLVKLFK